MNDYSWFKIYRKMEDWEWFTDSKTLHVFLYLMLRANIKNKKFNGRMIRRGQVVTSYQKIAGATGMSVSSAKRAISNLISTGEITMQSTNKYSIITIVKFDSYQQNNIEQIKEQTKEQAKEPVKKLSRQPAKDPTTKFPAEPQHKNTENKENNKTGKEPEKPKEEPKTETPRPKPEPKKGPKAPKFKRPDTPEHPYAGKYIPKYFEFKLQIPKKYLGQFETEADWWIYVKGHREEVRQAYEL